MTKYSSVPSSSRDRTTSSDRPFLSPHNSNEIMREDHSDQRDPPVTVKKKGDYCSLVTSLTTDDDEESAGDPSGAKAIPVDADDGFIGNDASCAAAGAPSSSSDNQDDSSSSVTSKCERVCKENLTADRSVEMNGHVLLDVYAVKFFKLLAFTCLGFVIIHYLARWMNWEIDPDFTLHDLVVYDFNYIVLDVMVFYVVGRLYKSRGVDHLVFVIPATVSAIYSSWANNFAMFRYSVSLYEMHCKWPLTLWIFCFVMVPFVSYLVWMHVKEAARQAILVRKFVELLLSIIIFILPYAGHPNFHLHHWYLGWLLGMNASLDGDIWWSRATMGYLWGFYINGIAVYGRDPVLTCAYAFYTSTDQHCPYMACYKPQDVNATHDYKPMVEPNWRNCTGYIP